MRAQPQLFWQWKCAEAFKYRHTADQEAHRGRENRKHNRRWAVRRDSSFNFLLLYISRAIFSYLPGRSSWPSSQFFSGHQLSILLINITHLFDWPKREARLEQPQCCLVSVGKQSPKSPSLFFFLFMYIAVSLLCTKFPSLHQTKKKKQQMLVSRKINLEYINQRVNPKRILEQISPDRSNTQCPF